MTTCEMSPCGESAVVFPLLSPCSQKAALHQQNIFQKTIRGLIFISVGSKFVLIIQNVIKLNERGVGHSI